MNHVAFICSPTSSSVSSITSQINCFKYHKHLRSFLPTYSPRKNLSSISCTRLAALPPGPLFFNVAFDIPDVEPTVQLVNRAVPLFAETSTSNVAYTTDFSATIDPGASSAVLFVILTLGALKFRTESISSAAKERKELAKKLKAARIRRITGEDGIGTEGGAYAAAELAYRDALDKESRMRTVLPGIEFMSPIAPVEEMRKESIELLPDLKSQYQNELNERAEDHRPSYSKDPKRLGERPISIFEMLMLSVVSLSQIALLVLFTYDPMQSSVYSSSFMTSFNS